MALLGVSNLTKAFGTDLLFEVQANDKIGVVGVNGSGKTTLFKMITGEMRPDDGELYQSKQAVVGYMEQHVCKNLEETALDEVLTVFTPLMKMEEEIELLNVRLQKGMGSAEELIERQALLNDRFVREGGMTYRSRARSAGPWLQRRGYDSDGRSIERRAEGQASIGENAPERGESAASR